MNADFLGQQVWLWCLFMGIVLTLLVLDLGVLHRNSKVISATESLWMSAGYILVSVLFGGWIWWHLGKEPGINYLTGFFVEKTLALDNIFVISLIFSYFAIPQAYQHRVLFWGVLGVIVLRGIMIGLGTVIVSEFSWVMYLFGAFLIFTGIKMLYASGHSGNLGDNKLVAFLRARMRVTNTLHGDRFFVRQAAPQTGKISWYATPLFLALVMVEFVDIIFAVDSVPAIFAITTDPFIVYTSNIFAILGLRALYFALAATMHRFTYLKYALSAVLIFIGGKIFWNQLVGKMDPLLSLSITLLILASGIVFSIVKTRRNQPTGENK
ncbi:MAG: integral rane TerC family protein [Alphaproteobacteria bacterium]|nr:integral rane TerC family protein [Alphaproteobacteria bacterium]